MKFSDREIARESKFPDRESREIGKYLCTGPEILFFSDSWKQVPTLESLFKLALMQELPIMRDGRKCSHVTLNHFLQKF